MDGDLTVREIMTREYVGVSESDGVGPTADLLLSEGADAAVVLRGSEAVGLLTDRDVLAHLANGGSADAPVTEPLSARPVTVPPAAGVVDAALRMAEADVGCLLVEDAEGPVGLLGERDVVRAVGSFADYPLVEAGGPTDEAAEQAAGPPTDDYSSASVCENCGAFAPELRNFNGQLICEDCRTV